MIKIRESGFVLSSMVFICLLLTFGGCTSGLDADNSSGVSEAALPVFEGSGIVHKVPR